MTFFPQIYALFCRILSRQTFTRFLRNPSKKICNMRFKTKGGGGQRVFEKCSKKLRIWWRMAPLILAHYFLWWQRLAIRKLTQVFQVLKRTHVWLQLVFLFNSWNLLILVNLSKMYFWPHWSSFLPEKVPISLKHRKNCETVLFKVWIVENVFCRKEVGRKGGK